MIIFDDVIDRQYQQSIVDVMLNPDFAWYYQKHTTKYGTVGSTVDKNTKDVPQFTHVFFADGAFRSSNYELVLPLIHALEAKTKKQYFNRILRIKSNLITQHENYPENYHCIAHTDVHPEDAGSETFLYYVNDSDGDTFIFNEKDGGENLTVNSRVSPQKGRAILFDSHIIHSSSPPKKNLERSVINFIFKAE
jgi:hypothetical protein